MFVVMTHTNDHSGLSFFGVYNSKSEAMNVIRGIENNGMFAVLLFTGDATYATETE